MAGVKGMKHGHRKIIIKGPDLYHTFNTKMDEEEIDRRTKIVDAEFKTANKNNSSDDLLLEKYEGTFDPNKFKGNNGVCETCHERDICIDLNKEYKWCVKENK